MKQSKCSPIVAAALFGACLMTLRVNAQECEDRVTGGGFILPDEQQFANFGAGGGFHKGDLWGYLTYLDHATSPPMQVSAQVVSAYCQLPDDCVPSSYECRRITYSDATIRIGGETFTADVSIEVCDAGEPGSADRFAICIPSLGYCVGGILGGDGRPSGGNVQLHSTGSDCVPVCENEEACPCFRRCLDGPE